VLGPIQRRSCSAYNWVQMKAAKCVNNIRVGLGNCGTAYVDSSNMCPFQGIHREMSLECDRG